MKNGNVISLIRRRDFPVQLPATKQASFVMESHGHHSLRLFLRREGSWLALTTEDNKESRGCTVQKRHPTPGASSACRNRATNT